MKKTIKKFTKCSDCKQEMAHGKGCTFTFPNRIPYGKEFRGGIKWDEYGDCHDCNVKSGQFHHFGCDVEECPICHDQLISCDHGSTLEKHLHLADKK